MAAQESPARYEVTTSDIEYLTVDGETFLATIYQPAGLTGAPGIVDVHGGAWTTGNRYGDKNVARGLAELGMVVMSPDFRVAPAGPYPAQVQDVHLAVRWLKQHAAELGADPGTIGAFGSSSGGNTAMLVAMRPYDARYCAHPLSSDVDATLRYVIAGWPIMDPYSRYFFAIETGRADLISRTEGYFPDQAAMREGNPQMILDRGETVELPPVLLIQGTADTNLTMAMTMKFAASYQARGGDATLEQFPGMAHNFCTDQCPETERAIELMREFVRRIAA